MGVFSCHLTTFDPRGPPPLPRQPVTALCAASGAGSIARVETLVTKGGANVNWTLSNGWRTLKRKEGQAFGGAATSRESPSPIDIFTTNTTKNNTTQEEIKHNG